MFPMESVIAQAVCVDHALALMNACDDKLSKIKSQLDTTFNKMLETQDELTHFPAILNGSIE